MKELTVCFGFHGFWQSFGKFYVAELNCKTQVASEARNAATRHSMV